MSQLHLSIWKKKHRLKMENRCDHSSAFNFKWIIFILADEKDNYESFDELEFCQDSITYYGVISP